MPVMKLAELPDTGRVVVACKLPRGLRLDLPVDQKMEEEQLAAYADARKNGRARDFQPMLLGEQPFITLKGWSVPYGMPAFHVSGGYGLTTGVDAAKFKRWYIRAQKNGYPPVMEDQVFACAKEADARDQAAEQAEVPQIAAPLDPENPGPGLKPDNRDDA